jgi:hypothetical protein
MRIINQIGVLTLLALLMVRVMVVPMIFLDYELRKDYIIQNYCVNKNRPELHCDGKCYLAKQIKTTEQQEQQQKGADFNRYLFGVEFIETQNEIIVFHLSKTKLLTNFEYRDSLSQKHLSSVFHPPSVVVG